MQLLNTLLERGILWAINVLEQIKKKETKKKKLKTWKQMPRKGRNTSLQS